MTSTISLGFSPFSRGHQIQVPGLVRALGTLEVGEGEACEKTRCRELPRTLLLVGVKAQQRVDPASQTSTAARTARRLQPRFLLNST